VHLDLYRLQEPSELDNLGLREWAKPGHVWLVEWPERGASRLPPADVSVQLVAGEAGHDIEAAAHTVLGQCWLVSLAQAAGAS
jgi:tRNA threonylcarbamoyladenosine biosynthesis protein TsaE